MIVGLLWPVSVGAQQRSVIVAWLGSGSPDPARQQAFERSLNEHGFTPRLEIRFAEGKLERLPGLAMDLVRLKPDLILVADAVSTAAVKKATSAIPIVMAGASDPAGLGLVESLARPGGNITGLTSPFGDEFTGKWIELLRTMRPGATRLAILYNPEIPAAKRRHEHMQKAAHSLGVQLVSLEVRRQEDFKRVFDHYKRTDAAGLIVDNAPFIMAHASEILDFAAKSRVATVWGHAVAVQAGGLVSYGAHFPDIYRKAGIYAAKIFNGADPANLPVEQPSKFELVINMKTAKSLNLPVPPSLLIQADHIIN